VPLFETTSEKTKCPHCWRKVPLEKVPLTDYFSCPFCQHDVTVSDGYKRIEFTVSVVSALSVTSMFVLDHHLILGLFLFFPAEFIVAFLIAYIGKYFVPPRLVSLALPKDGNTEL
jgi:DNA-directed RNA polymerase subunit RPC12/RpoP